MKKILLLCLFPILLHSQSQYRFFINNINFPIDNKGVLAHVNIPPDGSGGRFGVSTFLFSSGFMVSGYNYNTLWACGQATTSLVENFIPGNVDSNQTNPIYKIYVNDNSSTPNYPNWQEYINAVRAGASFYDGNGDGIYNPVDLNGNNQWDPNEDKPDIIGDKTTWCVYNDGVPGNQRTRFVGVDPVGLEIHQSLFGYATTNLLGNVIFIRYKLINTGKVNSKLDSVYFSAWADPDLGTEFDDDLVGCDTIRQSGFVYNGDANDVGGYGTSIPSFFISILEGPRSYIPGITYIDINSNGNYDDGIDTSLDTSYSRRGKDIGIEKFPGAKNLGINSFIHYQGSDPERGDPNIAIDAKNYMQGRLISGNLLNPCTDNRGQVMGGVDCNMTNPIYWYSGNPLANIGWINNSPSDQIMMVNTGPFQLETGKPVSIIVAYIVGQGTNQLNSITKAKEIFDYTNSFYLSNFGEFPVSVGEDHISHIPDDLQLYQNYPNPFNPSTTIKFSIPNVISTEGRNLNVTLKVYDVLGNEVATLVNEFRNAGSYEVDFDASSLSSGIYFYRLQAGLFVQTKKMIFLK